MRRLYIAPESVRHEHREYFGGIGAVGIDLIAYARVEDARLEREGAEWLALPAVQAWIAGGRMQLIQATVDHSEYCEDKWHSHPDVAILPHPTFEGTDKLSKHVIVRDKPKKDKNGNDVQGDILSGTPLKKIEQKHLDAAAIINILPTDTVWDISDKAAARDVSCRLRAIL